MIINTAGMENTAAKPDLAVMAANIEKAQAALQMQAAQAKATAVQILISPGIVPGGEAMAQGGQYIGGNIWGDVMINIVGIENAGGIPDVAAAGGASYEGAGSNVEGSQQAAQAKAPQVAKSIVDLVPGQVFSAEILDIQPGVINLRMGSDGVLAARTLASPDARIGDNATFVVRENVPGLGNTPAQIVLEFLRGGVVGQDGQNAQVPASIVKEALQAANMQHTGQNTALIGDLVAHNLPIDQSTVQRAAFFRYSMPDVPFPRIAFLLENNFAPTERTVEVFQKMASGEMNLKSETANLQQLVSETAFQNPATKEALQSMISGKLAFEPQAQQPQIQPQAQAQVVEMPNDQTTELGKFLTELRALTEEATALLQRSGEEHAPIRQSLENISDILDFARNIGDTKMYYQFPFVASGEEHLAELHIFKKKAARKTSGKNATALIGLDMAHLGRVEILVNKAGRDVALQFRTDSGRTISLVGEHKAKLADMLGDKGYLLTALGMKMIDEKFDIGSSDKKEVKEVKSDNIVADSTGAKRYSFDMRV